MFSVIKSENIPPSLSGNKYDGNDVHLQLSEDFSEKCYICGGTVEKREVEHFVPHGDDPNLKYGWNNLFLACGNCNGRKSDTYNKNGKDILNCTTENIENHIQHQILPIRGVEPKFKKLITSSKVDNTIELLNKIFTKNGGNNARQKLENRAKTEKLIAEIYKFQTDYNKYYDVRNKNYDPEYNERRNTLIRHFYKDSIFYEFKIGFLEIEPSMKQEVNKILIEVGLDSI